MAQVTYQYAIDENGKTVHISQVDANSRLGKMFRCLSCGAEMIAKIGDPNKKHTKASHFAHKNLCDCNQESYLHKLGKKKFKERFDSDDSILIRCSTNQLCVNYDLCPLANIDRCFTEKLENFNLKDWYDTCTEEKEYGGYRADLLLESSTNPNRPPVFVEIVNTHRCSDKKLRANHRVIEIDVSSESQLEKTIKGVLSEINGIRLYNFETKLSNTKCRGLATWFEHFTLFDSGKIFVEPILCNKAICDETMYANKGFLSYLIHKPWGPLGSPITAYDIAQVLVIDAGIKIQNCTYCKYHVIDSDIYKRKFIRCRLHEKFDTPLHPESAEAEACKYYRLDQDRIALTRAEMFKVECYKLPLKKHIS